MSRNPTAAVAALLSASIALGARPTGQALAAEDSLARAFEACLVARGAPYFALRSNIVERGAVATPFLEARRTSPDLHTRVEATAMLAWINDPAANQLRADLLLGLLRTAFRSHADPLMAVESQAYGAFGSIGGPVPPKDALHEAAAVPFLLEAALKGCSHVWSQPAGADAEKWDRCMATALVGGYQGQDVVPVLQEAIRDRDPCVRACGATGLARTKTIDGTRLLVGALDDADRAVRRTCRAALFDLTDQDFGEDKGKWLEWWEKNKSHWPFNDRVPGHNPVPVWAHDH